MNFNLPDLLEAERMGRALALTVETPTARIAVTPSFEGAACLAAARHLANRGVAVEVLLAAMQVETCELFAIFFEVLGCMDLPVISSTDSDNLALDGRGTSMDSRSARLNQSLLYPAWPAHGWDQLSFAPHGRANPYLTDTDPTAACSAAAVRAIDKRAIEDFGLPGLCLMENAGIGATVCAAAMVPRGQAPVCVLVGYGNNGGDGLVVARGLLESGVPTLALLLGSKDRLKGDAAVNATILEQAPQCMRPLPADDSELETLLAAAPLIVDGLFGTGLDRPVEGRAAEAIETVNRVDTPVLALDLPSGLDADNGVPLGTCILADETVTFAAPKTGFFKNDGPARCGRLRLAGIGFDPSCR